jgi:predicted outer membrane lipoprotein
MLEHLRGRTLAERVPGVHQLVLRPGVAVECFFGVGNAVILEHEADLQSRS